MRTHRGNRLVNALGLPLDHPLPVLLAIGCVLFVFWVIGTRSQPHHVRAAFSSGFNLVSGLSVDVDGLEVGKLSGVQYDNANGGQAIVTIGISDPKFWPLHAGTTIESRWGTTIGNGTRRLDVNPGPSTAPVIPEGGIIQTKDTLPAVDLDQVLNVFNAKTRGRLTSMLGRLGAGVRGQAGGIHNALDNGGPAVNAANAVLRDLASDTVALRGLITNGDRLTSTLASRAPAIQDLVTVAGATFNALATHANGVQQTISSLPGALVEARTTLGRLDRSVGTLQTLINTLAPGAAKLSPLAAALRPALSQLYTLVPTGVSTLQAATTAAPKITRLLTVATPFMPLLQTDTGQLAPMVACMRPYTPELAAAVLEADSWMSTYELVQPHGTPGITYVGPTQGPFVRQGGVRAMPQVSAATVDANTLTTQAFVNLTGLQYAEPRPPGYAVGQPWFQPQCGVTPAALDPSKDPEQRR